MIRRCFDAGLAPWALAAALLAAGVVDSGATGAATSSTQPDVATAPLPGFDAELTMPGVLAGAVDPDRYLVGPGDLFQIDFSGRVSRSLTLAVGPEGTVFIPGAGLVKVDGLTLTEARRELVRRAAQEFRGVRLDVRLSRARTLRVFVTGAVRAPGAVDAVAYRRLSEVLTDSLLLANSSRRNILVSHRQSSSGEPGAAPVIADLERFNRTGDARFDPLLLDGDVIHVPVATRSLAIEGAVARPGVVELGPLDSLSTLIDMAGGVLPSARSERCLLLRWRSPVEVESTFFDLGDVNAGLTNPPLSDGDRVYVYFQSRFHELASASVFGEVQRPGAYPLDSHRTHLSALIRAAGGFLDRADLSTIRVYRANRQASEADPEFDRLARLSRTEMSASEYEVLRARMTARREDYRVDWNRLLASPDLDFELRDGDVVRVDAVLASVRVEGEVRHPGLVEFKPDRSAAEYVALAGGFSRRAASSKVRLTRAVTGQSALARDIPMIAPGDLIWVPERPDITVVAESPDPDHGGRPSGDRDHSGPTLSRPRIP